MRAAFVRLLITSFGLWIADVILPGISFSGIGSLWLAALLLGLVNAFIRPIVILLTLPLTLFTLGLFLLVINGAMLLLVSNLMDSFQLRGLGTAVLASIIVGITGWLGNGYVNDQAKFEVWKSQQGRKP